MTRDTPIDAVMEETKRADKESFLQTKFSEVMKFMSSAVTEDGEPIPLEDLKADPDDEIFEIKEGDYYFDFPSNFVFAWGIPEFRYSSTDARQMTKKDRAWMDLYYPNRPNDTTNKNRPSFYSLDNKRFDFAPMSDGDYTIVFPHTILHPAVTADSGAGSTILFGDKYLECIKDFLKAKLFELLDDPDKMSFHFGRGLAFLKAQAIVERRNSRQPLVARYNDI